MNMKTIQKHYDKLTVEERFSAMIAALGREDEAEYTALARNAPYGKTWKLRDTYGILSAFEWLGMWHILTQLGEIAYFYFLLFHGEDDIKVKGFDFDEAIDLITKRILEGREAWRGICKDYNVDPTDALKHYPFIEFIEMVEIIANAASIQMNIEPDFEKTLESYRFAIKTKRVEWE